MTSVDFVDKIPNNVGLREDKRTQKALETWLGGFNNWWRSRGPQCFPEADIYLRTAVNVGRDGWAQFGFLKMPDYRFGILLADPEADRRILR